MTVCCPHPVHLKGTMRYECTYEYMYAFVKIKGIAALLENSFGTIITPPSPPPPPPRMPLWLEAIKGAMLATLPLRGGRAAPLFL